MIAILTSSAVVLSPSRARFARAGRIPAGAATPRPHVALMPARHHLLASRVGRISAAEAAQPAYTTTAGGLLLKEVTAGSGSEPQQGQIVTVDYTASVVGPDAIISRNPEFSFVLGTEMKKDPGRRFAWGAPSRTYDQLPLFQEAMEGMRVGGVRRVSVPPSSRFSAQAEQTVQFELGLVSIKSGVGAAAFRASELWKELNAGPIVIVSCVVLFSGDLRELLASVLPSEVLEALVGKPSVRLDELGL